MRSDQWRASAASASPATWPSSAEVRRLQGPSAASPLVTCDDDGTARFAKLLPKLQADEPAVGGGGASGIS